MDLFLPLILVIGLILAANKVEVSERQELRRFFLWFMLGLNVLPVLLGLGLLIVPDDLYAPLFESGFPPIDMNALGFTLIGAGLWGIICCLRPFREFLAKAIPLDPDSEVHLTALVLAGYLVGNTVIALSQEFLQQLSETELAVSVADVVLQQLAFVLLALSGAGLFVRRDFKGLNQRLGIVMPTVPELAIGGVVIVLLILIQGTVGAVWALLDPEQAAQLGSLNEALLSGFDSLGEWFALALASGIGEEMLFRGALQPVFGLPVTSFLFAVVHIQYGLTPITIVVFVLGLILGLVRRFTNTTVAIFVHFGYNFALGLLSMLALYLEQFVTP